MSVSTIQLPDPLEVFAPTITYAGQQQTASGPSLAMFTDSVTKTTFMLKPGDDFVAKLAEVRGRFQK